MVMYKASAVHFSTTMSLMNKLRQEQSFCDVTLTVGQDHIQAHKCVLAAGSPYFQTLFLGRFTESSKNAIDLSEVTNDSDALEMIIDFIYTGQVDIDSSNLRVLVKLSSFFLVETLQRFCIEFMQTTLNLKTCLRYYLYSSDHGLTETLEMTEAMVTTRFHDCIIFGQESLDVSPDEMSCLINKNIFKFCSSSSLMHYVCKWVLRGRSDKHFLIGSDLLDNILQLQSPTSHSLSSVKDIVEVLKSTLTGASIEGQDDFLNKCDLIVETGNATVSLESETKMAKSEPKTKVNQISNLDCASCLGQPSSDITNETTGSEGCSTTKSDTENVVITLSPRAAVYEQTNNEDLYDFAQLENKPLFDLCAYVPNRRQWFYIRSFNVNDYPTELFESWTEWGFHMLGQELLIIKASGDDDLNLYSLQEDRWRVLKFSGQIEHMWPLNSIGNDYCFVADADDKMYLIFQVRVFSDLNDWEPYEIYFKGYQFEHSSSSWESVFESDRIDVSETRSSCNMNMSSKVSSTSREMIMIYSTYEHSIALVVDLTQTVKQSLTLLTDFSEAEILKGIRIVEVSDRFLLVTDGTHVSKGVVQVKFEYVFHSRKLISVTDSVARSIGEFKMTPSLHKRQISPCLQQVGVGHGACLWYLEGNMGNVSSLSQITFDKERSSTVVQHTPPPFTSITAMFIGQIGTNLLSRLNLIHKCF